MKLIRFTLGVILTVALAGCGEEEKQAQTAVEQKQQTLEKVEKLKETTNDGQRF